MKYIEDIEKFNQKIKRIEKLLFLSKFFKNKKIFLTTLEEQHHAGKLLLVSILKWNHAKGEIEISNNPEENIQILKEKISIDWEIEEEVKRIIELFELNKKHKSSPVEFMKKGSIIILDDSQNITKISFKELNEFSKSIKQIKNIFAEKI